jgi:uncharacterized membrane protein YfcA
MLVYTMLRYIAYTFIGLLAGISMGTIGMGAGLIAVPLLTLTGLNIKQVIAAIMVMQLLPQSIMGVINYKEHIDWASTTLVILGSLFGIWFGSHLVANDYIDERLIYRILTIFLFSSSVYFFRNNW